VEDAPRRADGQVDGLALDHAPPAVAEADEVVPVDALALPDDRPDDGVEARTVAAAGQHADPHRSKLLRLLENRR
jgi:hypothetical protein